MKWIDREHIKAFEKRVEMLLPIAMRKEPDFIEDKILEGLRADLVKTEKDYHYLMDKNKDDLKTVLEVTKEFSSYVLSVVNVKLTYCMLEINMSQEAVDYREQLYKTGLGRSSDERATIRVLNMSNIKEDVYAQTGSQSIEIKKIIEKRFSSDGVYQTKK